MMGPVLIQIELHASIYRAVKHEIWHPTYLCEQLDKGNICPACPKVNI